MEELVSMARICPIAGCRVNEAIAVDRERMTAMEGTLESLAKSLDRIQWATVTALGALVLACLTAIFRLLHAI